MEAAAKHSLGHLGSAVDVDFNDPRWLSTVRDRLDKLVGVNETTVERARSALVQGLADSVSTAELRQSLEAVFDGNGSRALLVARTEVGSVASSARDEAFGEAGIERTEWLSAKDDVVRESHAQVDGEIVDRGQNFSNGMRYPHDPAASADEICNCRCDHAPVL
jgi:SPP1 gp7 family putative phage head morphogenesis protein